MGSMDISASGLYAQRMRMDTIANNLANAETTRTAQGGPYQRKTPVFQEDLENGGVKVDAIIGDPRPFPQVHQPGHPDADPATGIVRLPNVNPVEEMVDLVTASRAYEANVTALNASKAMVQKSLEIGHE